MTSIGFGGLGMASDSERAEFELEIVYDDFQIVKTAWEKYQILSAALDETMIAQSDTPAGLKRIQTYGVTPQEYLERLEAFGLQAQEYLKTWKNEETGKAAEEYVRLKAESIVKMARRGIAIHGDLEFQNLKKYFDYFKEVVNNREDRFEIVRNWTARSEKVERRNEMNQMRQVLRYAREICEDLDDGELVTRPILDAESTLTRRHMMLYPEFEGVFPITEVKCVSGRQCEKELDLFKHNDRLVVAYTYDTRAVDRYHRLITVTNSRAVTATFSFPQVEDREADGGVWEASSALGTGGVANIRMELDLPGHRFRKIELEVRHHVFELTVDDRSEHTTLRIYDEQRALRGKTSEPLPLDWLKRTAFSGTLSGTSRDGASAGKSLVIDVPALTFKDDIEIQFEGMPPVMVSERDSVSASLQLSSAMVHFNQGEFYPQSGIVTLIGSPMNSEVVVKMVLKIVGDRLDSDGSRLIRLQGAYFTTWGHEIKTLELEGRFK